MTRWLTTTVLALSLAGTAAAEDVLKRADGRFEGAATNEVPSFRKHVIPLLGKLGCNGRACHGSFQGQGGFRLSLFGYDFKMDHEGLLGGDEPRVDPEFAENSIALLKPTLEMPHRGGKRLDEGGWEYNLLVRWIESGAKNVDDTHPEFSRIEVTPKEIVFDEADQTSQLKVVAVWSDGSREDVTPLCRFKSNSTTQATIDEAGLVTAVEPGDTHVVVFYDNGVVPIPVIQPVSKSVGPAYPKVPTPTKVDELVVDKLKKLGIVQSDVCTDAEFLRRVSLDMIGTLPTPKEVEAFIADGSPDKRARKIDELLERPAYAAWWATKLCDFTGNNDAVLNNVTPNRTDASYHWYEWIRHRVENNTPYDDLVAGIVLGKSRDEGESFEEFCRSMSELTGDREGQFADRESMPFYWARRNFRQPEERVIGFAYTFLGIRIQCAQCHKHPFDQWTQEDFRRFTPFFTSVQFGNNPSSRNEYNALVEKLGLKDKRGGDLRRELAKLARDGKTVPYQEVFVNQSANRRGQSNVRQLERQLEALQQRIADLKADGKPEQAKRFEAQVKRIKQRIKQLADQVNAGSAEAKLLGGDEIDVTTLDDPREPLMEWLRTNPLFAKAFVNRVWASYFNVGIVQPADDLSLANPPSNAALLDHLAEGFMANGYDMKWLHRRIANSRTYQLSWVPNETNRLDERNFSHAIPRRLPAEVAIDALQQATGSDEAIAKFHANLEARSIALPSPPRNNSNYALGIFGASRRESNCDCDRSMEASLLQTVFLQNDQDLYRMIDRRGDGWLFNVARDMGAKFQGTQAPTNRLNEQQRQRILQRLKQEEKQLAKLRKQGKTDQADRLAARIAQVRKRFKVGEKPAKPSKEDGEKIELDADAVVRDVYLRTLSRPPRPEELARAKEYLTDADDTVTGLRDLMWALLNTKEFIVNH